jgi:hypothetical protein
MNFPKDDIHGRRPIKRCRPPSDCGNILENYQRYIGQNYQR